MITAVTIDNWLKEPHQLQEVAPAALAAFAMDFGYFQPIHYLKSLTGPVADEAGYFALRQLFPANPILLHELRSRALSRRPDVPVVEDASEAQEAGAGVPIDMPLQTDYFASQGIEVPAALPEVDTVVPEGAAPLGAEEEKSLMVMMTFAEWLVYMQSKSRKEKEEEADKKALKTMWQKQKLAAAIEEEDEEIPESVFEMAVNSISRNDEWVSESLAMVYAKQGKKKQAIEVYRKLSLLDPEKSVYFAAKIEHLQKDLEV